MKGKQSGLTLVEILLALAIFAIIGVICAYAIRHMVDMHNRINKINASISDTQIALVLMQRDLHEIVDRPYLDERAHPVQTIMLGGSELSFVNASHLELSANSQHSNLQRIAYALQGKTLVRKIWPVLDEATSNNTAAIQPLLTGVDNLSFQLIDQNNRAQTVWPPPGASSTQGDPMPKAVIVKMSIKGWGELEKIIATPGDSFYVH